MYWSRKCQISEISSAASGGVDPDAAPSIAAVLVTSNMKKRFQINSFKLSFLVVTLSIKNTEFLENVKVKQLFKKQFLGKDINMK